MLLAEVRASATSRQSDLECRVAELRQEVQELTSQLAQERQAQQSTVASKQGKMLVSSGRAFRRRWAEAWGTAVLGFLGGSRAFSLRLKVFSTSSSRQTHLAR
jgi:uncharacterized coiled-coil protein SlyX